MTSSLSFSETELEDGIDRIFDTIDDLFHEGAFHQVDSILENLVVEKIHTTLLVCYLAITLAAKEHLPWREIFFARVKEEMFRREGGRRPNLLKNLE